MPQNIGDDIVADTKVVYDSAGFLCVRYRGDIMKIIKFDWSNIAILMSIWYRILTSLWCHSNILPISECPLGTHQFVTCWLTSKLWNNLAKLPNPWVFIYELSGCGFEGPCSNLNFRYRTCFEEGVPWHSEKYRLWIHPETCTRHENKIQSNEP